MYDDNDFMNNLLLGDEDTSRDEFESNTDIDYTSPAYDFREFEDLYIDEKGDLDSDYEDAIENYSEDY